MSTPKDESNVENLIDISPVEDKSVDKEDTYAYIEEKCDELTEETSKGEQNVTPPYVTGTKHYSRLCGYLNKLGNRTILRTFRKRWFVFNENNCKLYYYKSPQDQIPLGEIDISLATFTFEVNNKERSGLFTIRYHLYII